MYFICFFSYIMSSFRITVLSSLTASLIFYFIELVLDTTMWGSKKQHKITKQILKLVWWLSLPIKRVLYTIRFGLSYWIDRITKYKYILKVYYNPQTHKRMWDLQDRYTRWIIKESAWFDTEYECKNRVKEYLWIKRFYGSHKEDKATFYSVYISDKKFWEKIKKSTNTISFSVISGVDDK